MSVSLYDVSIPVMTLGLTNLVTVLDKAAAHAEAKKADPLAFPQARLIADMFSLTRQVQTACDTAKGAAARLAGIEVPKHEDTETTLAELKARIGKTLDFIQSVKPAQLQGAETREIVLKFPGVTLTFNGLDYLRKFVLPNFFFHATMAYAIIRTNGVAIGKSDFLGAIQ
jgi:uncharacterized protein